MKYWRKLGNLYQLPLGGLHTKLQTHAANPVAILLEGDVYRIFFSARDPQNRSSVGAVDVNVRKRKIAFEHHHPFFSFGCEGSFYADGVSIGDWYEVDGRSFLLFMGWQNPTDAHWRGDIGRLELDVNFNLQIVDEYPFMTTDEIDPISLSYPWVHQDGEGYSMWYGSTRTWDAGNNEMLHVLNFANSENGQNWTKKGLSIPYREGIAQAFSRPTVAVTASNRLEMWFSYRGGNGDKYKIGYASQREDLEWELQLDNSGIEQSQQGWDSEMICYPFVFDHQGDRYMLYNGNSYGKTGFGLAILED